MNWGRFLNSVGCDERRMKIRARDSPLLMLTIYKGGQNKQATAKSKRSRRLGEYCKAPKISGAKHRSPPKAIRGLDRKWRLPKSFSTPLNREAKGT